MRRIPTHLPAEVTVEDKTVSNPPLYLLTWHAGDEFGTSALNGSTEVEMVVRAAASGTRDGARTATGPAAPGSAGHHEIGPRREQP